MERMLLFGSERPSRYRILFLIDTAIICYEYCPGLVSLDVTHRRRCGLHTWCVGPAGGEPPDCGGALIIGSFLHDLLILLLLIHPMIQEAGHRSVDLLTGTTAHRPR